MHGRRVVITGLGVITPIGNDIPSFWDALVKGTSGGGPITRFDASEYTSRIAAEVKGFDPAKYLSSKEIKRTARFVHFAVAATKQAIEDAGLQIDQEDPYRCGVLIGTGIGGLDVIEEQHSILLTKGPGRMSVFTIPMLITNMAAGYVSILYGLKGPNMCISTACASGGHSIGEAFNMIKFGEADIMVTGGTEACITPTGVGGFCACKALTTRNDEPQHASRPFDKHRDGFLMGEGAGIVILEELEHAKRRGAKIYAELIGYGANADAYHMTAPAPDSEAAANCMKCALKGAGISPEEVSYINPHGTSTPLNDKYETQAIKMVFGESAYKIPVSSTKSMIGHLLGAAGAVELIVCVLAIKNNLIPPTINYEEPDPECDLDYVPNIARDWNVDVALSNSLGFGGHNAVLIVRRYEG